MLVRYQYSLDKKVVGSYECEVEDFKKLWKYIKDDVDWCVVVIKEFGIKWSLCDCWMYEKSKRKLRNYYGWNRGWKYLKGR